jgi:hypothetical protein
MKTSLSLGQIPAARRAELSRKYKYGEERIKKLIDIPAPIAIDVLSRQHVMFHEQQQSIINHLVTPESPLPALAAALQPVLMPGWRGWKVKNIRTFGQLLSTKYLSCRQKALLRKALKIDSLKRKQIREEKRRKALLKKTKSISKRLSKHCKKKTRY